jgi:DNA-nicking Smr family endonuclease
VNSDEHSDKALFRAAVRDAQPLKPSARIGHAPGPRKPPQARFARAERGAVLAESLGQPGPFIETQPGDELNYRREGVDLLLLRRLRRGDFRVESVIDLHGLTSQAASVALVQFLAGALARGHRCVRVIHGKGMRSGPRGPVLKQTVNTLLRRANHVLAFTSARARDGGTGATLVLLGRLK